jgi:hypothetical protein
MSGKVSTLLLALLMRIIPPIAVQRQLPTLNVNGEIGRPKNSSLLTSNLIQPWSVQAAQIERQEAIERTPVPRSSIRLGGTFTSANVKPLIFLRNWWLRTSL